MNNHRIPSTKAVLLNAKVLFIIKNPHKNQTAKLHVVNSHTLDHEIIDLKKSLNMCVADVVFVKAGHYFYYFELDEGTIGSEEEPFEIVVTDEAVVKEKFMYAI